MGITATEFGGGLPAIVVSRANPFSRKGGRTYAFSGKQARRICGVVEAALAQSWEELLGETRSNAFQKFYPPKLRGYIKGLTGAGASVEGNPPQMQMVLDHADDGHVFYVPADIALAPFDRSGLTEKQVRTGLKSQAESVLAYREVCERAVPIIETMLKRKRIVRSSRGTGIGASVCCAELVAGHPLDVESARRHIEGLGLHAVTADTDGLREIVFDVDDAARRTRAGIPAFLLLTRSAEEMEKTHAAVARLAGYGESHDERHIVPALVRLELAPTSVNNPMPMIFARTEHPSPDISAGFLGNFKAIRWEGEKPAVDDESLADISAKLGMFIARCKERGVPVDLASQVSAGFREHGMTELELGLLKKAYENQIIGPILRGLKGKGSEDDA